MPNVNVYLIDYTFGDLDDAGRNRTRSRLQSLMNEVCLFSVRPPNTTDLTVNVEWRTDAPVWSGLDVFCYFTRSGGQGVGTFSSIPPSGDESGWSFTSNSAWYSEVFTQTDSSRGFPTMQADFAFHEIMHNKLGRGNSMHRIRGMGIGRAVLSFTELVSSDHVAIVDDPVTPGDERIHTHYSLSTADKRELRRRLLVATQQGRVTLAEFTPFYRDAFPS